MKYCVARLYDYAATDINYMTINNVYTLIELYKDKPIGQKILEEFEKCIADDTYEEQFGMNNFFAFDVTQTCNRFVEMYRKARHNTRTPNTRAKEYKYIGTYNKILCVDLCNIVRNSYIHRRFIRYTFGVDPFEKTERKLLIPK